MVRLARPTSSTSLGPPITAGMTCVSQAIRRRSATPSMVPFSVIAVAPGTASRSCACVDAASADAAFGAAGRGFASDRDSSSAPATAARSLEPPRRLSSVASTIICVGLGTIQTSSPPRSPAAAPASRGVARFFRRAKDRHGIPGHRVGVLGTTGSSRISSRIGCTMAPGGGEQPRERVGGSLLHAAPTRFRQLFVTPPVPLDSAHQESVDCIARERVKLGPQVPHAVVGVDPHRSRPSCALARPPLCIALASPRCFRGTHGLPCLVCRLVPSLLAQVPSRLVGDLRRSDQSSLLCVDHAVSQRRSHLRLRIQNLCLAFNAARQRASHPRGIDQRFCRRGLPATRMQPAPCRLASQRAARPLEHVDGPLHRLRAPHHILIVRSLRLITADQGTVQQRLHRSIHSITDTAGVAANFALTSLRQPRTHLRQARPADQRADRGLRATAKSMPRAGGHEGQRIRGV